jgi:hypothetical protein
MRLGRASGEADSNTSILQSSDNHRSLQALQEVSNSGFLNSKAVKYNVYKNISDNFLVKENRGLWLLGILKSPGILTPKRKLQDLKLLKPIDANSSPSKY